MILLNKSVWSDKCCHHLHLFDPHKTFPCLNQEIVGWMCHVTHGVHNVDQIGWVMWGSSPTLVTDNLATSVQVMFKAKARPDSQERLHYVAWPEQTRTQARTAAGDRCHHLEKKVGFNCLCCWDRHQTGDTIPPSAPFCLLRSVGATLPVGECSDNRDHCSHLPLLF